MTYKDFRAMLLTTGLPTEYSAFKTAQTAPYICFTTDKTPEGSDYANELIDANYRVELYSKLNYDGANIAKIEELFDSRGIKYEATYGIYISETQLFMSIWEINFYYKK